MSVALPRRTAHRYLAPLREGGSLPAVIDTDDGRFVVKFHGAGQGPLALVAEIVVGELARALGLPIPDLALVKVPPGFGKNEPDPEISELLQRSVGVNLGMRYLDGAFNFDAGAARGFISPELAARVVWLDALTANPDRTAKNPNLLVWERQPWLIDHGAALYVHHDWARAGDPRRSFGRIREHVLLSAAADLPGADAELAERAGAALERVTALVPDELLRDDPASARVHYVEFLRARLQPPRPFLDEAVAARAAVLSEPPRRIPARR